jgi:endoglucanase
VGGLSPPVAPGGYYTNGGTVCTADGTPHLFHGVDRPSLEWSPVGVLLSTDDFNLMSSWGANVVRIALNQDFWLSGAALNDPGYPTEVDQAVQWAEEAGLDVILDLHWSDEGDLGAKDTNGRGRGHSNQQPMADTNSIEFWSEVAAKYKDDGHVLFELYNEPHDITWDVWLKGGAAGPFVAAGMQELYDAVRATGANNIVIAGGLSYAFDLSGVGASGSYIKGYNVMYATHPYLLSGAGNAQSSWEGSFGHLETTDFAPVIATEFGDGRNNCTGDWDGQLIAFADAHHMSWTAWAWFGGASTTTDPQGCRFPALIVDWSATPSVQGLVVRGALQGYPDSMQPPRRDAGGEPPDALADTAADAQGDATLGSLGDGSNGEDASDDADTSMGSDDADSSDEADTSDDAATDVALDGAEEAADAPIDGGLDDSATDVFVAPAE